MASRIMVDSPKVVGPETKYISFRFFPQGASVTPLTPANGFVKGDVEMIANVTRTGTAGEFTVTMQDPYVNDLVIIPSLQLNALTNLSIQLGAVSNLGTGTALSFLVRAHAAGVATDIAANANNQIHVKLELRDNAANPQA